MKKLTTLRLNFAVAVLLVFFLIFSSSYTSNTAYAVKGLDYEYSNVLDDLTGSVVNGKPFNLTDYPFNTKRSPQIISFAEYCYSFNESKQADYGLYVYIYNPQGLKIDTSTERNKIQFAYGGKANWNKYVLKFLNYSTLAGYEGLFYKFKVILSESQRSSILTTLSQNSRVYEISGFELSVNNVVSDYLIDYNKEKNKILTYTYSGYAKGYGSDLATDDTLSCVVDGVKQVLSPNVHSTYWRPAGTHSDGYTKDTLHSVYFSVPNSVIAEYGEMTAVHATWLNAYTAPIFVTGNTDIYKVLFPYLAKEVDGGTIYDYERDLDYSLIASKAVASARESEEAAMSGYYAYNTYSGNSYVYDNNFNVLNYIFLAENGNADNYVLPASKLVGDKSKGIKGWFETYTEKFVASNYVNDKYSSALFESYDSTFTDIEISSDIEYKLTDNTVSDNLWTRLFGGSLKKENSYDISAIQKVTGKDISFYSDRTVFCDTFYVAESDYSDFCAYVTASEKNNETVYLFRYYQSEYVCHEVTEYERVVDWALVGGNFGNYKPIDTNAYFAQEWVQLDFDIIDLTFTKNGVKTVIPVVMSPMDIAADADPPVNTSSKGNGDDKDLSKIIALILGLLLLIVLLVVFAPIIPYILQGIVWVIMLPIRFVWWIAKKIKTYKRNKNE